MNVKIFFSLVLAVVVSTLAQAEILKYTDSNGKTYFVDSEEKVPEPYKKQSAETKLRPISKMQSRDYEKIENPTTISTGRKRMEIFVTSWCPHCRELEAYLDSRRVQYTRYDIEKDSAGKAKYDQMGLRGVPVVKFGSSVIRGFDRNQIEELIQR